MKKELQMTIKRKGILNGFICELIASYNEGKGSYTLQEINAILKGKKIDFPSTLENLNTMHLDNEIIISENGKDVSVIIEERELMILNENITDEISELG
jgi:hypothetical protein